MAFDGSNKPKTCIIGAGCSGFTMAKRLKDKGLPYDCFEMSDNIGGNWYLVLLSEPAHRHVEMAPRL